MTFQGFNRPGDVKKGLRKGNIDVLNDLGMEFPLEIPSGLMCFGYNVYNGSGYDICGDYCLVRVDGGNNIELHNTTNPVGSTKVTTLVLSVLIAIGKDFYVKANTAANSLISTYDLATYSSLNNVNLTSSLAAVQIETDGTYLYVSDNSGRVLKYDKKLNLLATLAQPGDMGAFLYRPLLVPKGSHPYIYFGYITSGGLYSKILKLDKSTMQVVSTSSNLPAATTGGPYSYIAGIDLTDNSLIYVGWDGSWVNIVKLNGNLTTAWSIAPPTNYGQILSLSVIIGKNSIIIYGTYQNPTATPAVWIVNKATGTYRYSLISATSYSGNAYGSCLAFDIDNRKYLRGSNTPGGGNNLYVNIGYNKI